LLHAYSEKGITDFCQFWYVMVLLLFLIYNFSSVFYAQLIYGKFDEVGVVVFGTRGILISYTLLIADFCLIFCIVRVRFTDFLLMLVFNFALLKFLETDNELTKEVGGYEHVVVLRNIKVVDGDLVDAFQELPRGNFDGDCIHWIFLYYLFWKFMLCAGVLLHYCY
jgi:hypothetical protein